MPTKPFVRCLAVLACLGILASSAPSLSSASKSTVKINIIQSIKLPALVISSLVPAMRTTAVGDEIPVLSGKVRPTGDIPTPVPSKGD
jgi:hypothetical protein